MNDFWQTVAAALETVAALLARVDPHYLLLAVALLIWFRLGRIVRALKSRAAPAAEPERVEQMQAKHRSMSERIAGLQAPGTAEPAAAPGPTLRAPEGDPPTGARPLRVRRDEAI